MSGYMTNSSSYTQLGDTVLYIIPMTSTHFQPVAIYLYDVHSCQNRCRVSSCYFILFCRRLLTQSVETVSGRPTLRRQYCGIGLFPGNGVAKFKVFCELIVPSTSIYLSFPPIVSLQLCPLPCLSDGRQQTFAHNGLPKTPLRLKKKKKNLSTIINVVLLSSLGTLGTRDTRSSPVGTCTVNRNCPYFLSFSLSLPYRS